MHHIAQGSKHLDYFLKAGPGHTVLCQSFCLTKSLCSLLRNNAGAYQLTNEDLRLLDIYITTAESLHQELGPLYDKISAKIAKAGFPVIPIPGCFICHDQQNDKTYNFNIINALTGWSAKRQSYYWIASGISVGDNLGSALIDILSAYFHAVQPGIEVYYIGRTACRADLYRQAMDIWNTCHINNIGLHCMTFELKTSSHQQQ